MFLSAAMVSRRRILAGVGAAVTSFSLPCGLRAQEAPERAPDGFQTLRARSGSIRLGVAGTAATPIWGYQDGAAGPLLRVRRGEELRVRLFNALPDPTAIHWHGVRVPNLADGAPGLTQAAVGPGAPFEYRFRPPDAGTFWYHAPWSAAAAPSDEQAPRQRLYGVLIVEEVEPLAVDREHVLVFDDWPTAPDDRPDDPALPFQAQRGQIMANGMQVPDFRCRPTSGCACGWSMPPRRGW